MNDLITRLQALSSAEDFLDFYGVPHEAAVVQVNRLHILKRFHQYLRRADDLAGLDDIELFRRYRDCLAMAYQDFVHSSAQRERVFKVFQDAEGRETRFEAFRGRGLVVNFWATWCPPCVAEMPALDRAYGLLQRDGIVVLALSSDRGGKAQVEPFYQRTGLRQKDWKATRAMMGHLLHQSWPLIIYGMALLIHARIDQVMIFDVL